METLIQLFTADSVAHTVLILTIIIAAGIFVGSLNFFGIRLGVAGVLFAGILLGHFKIAINQETAEFVREFGLILFVYTIGMQVGPGFFSSLKREGARLNAAAAAIVLMGAVITVLLSRFWHIPMSVAVGMFAGASTNTPSLAAAQQALKEISGLPADALKMPGLGYAVCYPFGILGILLTMILIRTGLKIAPKSEAEKYEQQHAKHKTVIEAADFRVENVNLNACSAETLPLPEKVVLSRIMHGEEAQIVSPDSRIYTGDVIRAVGSREALESLRLLLGSRIRFDWGQGNEEIVTQRVLVTRREVVGKELGDLDPFLYGVTVTRIRRGEVEFPAASDIEVKIADTLMVVGEAHGIKRFAAIVGNSVKHLDHPELIPIFVGIAFGVILGSLPFHIPGMPAPVKLGLAGGPLLAAILLSWVGRIGKLIWYMPASANFMLREIGISLFLACVGLRSGDKFVETLVTGHGMQWMLGGALITFVPLAVTGFFMRFKYKLNYLSICGLLAGSMTDPPALAFANQIYPSNAQVISYAAVYPLVMILRVLAAQALVIFFAG